LVQVEAGRLIDAGGEASAGEVPERRFPEGRRRRLGGDRVVDGRPQVLAPDRSPRQGEVLRHDVECGVLIHHEAPVDRSLLELPEAVGFGAEGGTLPIPTSPTTVPVLTVRSPIASLPVPQPKWKTANWPAPPRGTAAPLLGEGNRSKTAATRRARDANRPPLGFVTCGTDMDFRNISSSPVPELRRDSRYFSSHEATLLPRTGQRRAQHGGLSGGAVDGLRCHGRARYTPRPTPWPLRRRR